MVPPTEIQLVVISNICILYQIYAFYTRTWLKMADDISRRDLIQDALEHISRFDISVKTWKRFRIPTIILVFHPPSVRFYNVNWQGFKNTIRILVLYKKLLRILSFNTETHIFDTTNIFRMHIFDIEQMFTKKEFYPLCRAP